jgi:hypothetical protein
LASTSLTQPEVYQTIWEMLPHILRSRQLKGRVAKLYDLHRRHYDEVFAGNGEELDPKTLRSYASLLIAVLDGLAIQKALDPEGVDIEAIFALWAEILSASVLTNQASEAGPPAEG